jgi:hypothetical protein
MDIHRGRAVGWVIAAGIVIVIFLLARFSNLIVDWLWLEER